MRKSKILFLFNIILVICIACLSYFFFMRIRSLEREVISLNEKQQNYKSKYFSILKEKELLQRCYRIEKEISVIRGLSLKDPITYKVIGKTRLYEILLERFAEVYEGNSFFDMEEALKIMGMINKDVDLKDVLMKLYHEQAAAFYDYDNKIMYLVNSAFFTKSLENMFIAHELTHAIQDQHYGLVEMGIDRKENDDKVIALEALLEGDATFVMEKFYKQNLGLGAFLDVVSGVVLELGQKEMDNAPSYIRENMMFPYIKGLNFVKCVYNNDFFDMENVFLNTPVSSEQILHTEKYFINRDEPDYPELPELTDFFKKNNLISLYENILGELNISILLKRHLPSQLSNDAAYGWDGDRYVVFKSPDNDSLNGYILHTRWDSFDDSREFFEAFYQWVKVHYGVTQNHYIDQSYSVTINLDDNQLCYISLRSNDCVIICVSEIFMEPLKEILFSSE